MSTNLQRYNENQQVIIEITNNHRNLRKSNGKLPEINKIVVDSKGGWWVMKVVVYFTRSLCIRIRGCNKSCLY